MPGTFIDVDVDPAVAGDPALAAKLAEVCPVDIYATRGEDGTLDVVERNLDECVLCRLCIDAAPAGHGARREALRRQRDALLTRLGARQARTQPVWRASYANRRGRRLARSESVRSA